MEVIRKSLFEMLGKNTVIKMNNIINRFISIYDIDLDRNSEFVGSLIEIV